MPPKCSGACPKSAARLTFDDQNVVTLNTCNSQLKTEYIDGRAQIVDLSARSFQRQFIRRRPKAKYPKAHDPELNFESVRVERDRGAFVC